MFPFLHDPVTGAVRVPAHIERQLSEALGRPVRIRNIRELAQTTTALMRQRIYKVLTDMALGKR